MADVVISWAELRLPPASVIRNAAAAQSVGAFMQTASAVVITSAVTEISWASLRIPATAAATANLSAAQQVGAFTQSASMSDIIGQISGGGTISNEKPHRSIGATQSVGIFSQSAAIGAPGAPGPALAVANQQVGDFTQVALADAMRVMRAAQTIEAFSQSAYIGDRPQPEQPATGGGYGNSQPRKFKTRVGRRTIEGDTYDEMWRKALIAKAQDDAPRQPRIARATVVDKPVDPVETVRSEMQTQLAVLQRQMAELAQQRAKDAQVIAQTYESRLAIAESGTRAALALAQKAQNDMQALAALLTE